MREIDIVFDGPPDHEAGRFVEVEDTATGQSLSVGEWVHREDGYWALRLTVQSPASSLVRSAEEYNQLPDTVLRIVSFQDRIPLEALDENDREFVVKRGGSYYYPGVFGPFTVDHVAKRYVCRVVEEVLS